MEKQHFSFRVESMCWSEKMGAEKQTSWTQSFIWDLQKVRFRQISSASLEDNLIFLLKGSLGWRLKYWSWIVLFKLE